MPLCPSLKTFKSGWMIMNLLQGVFEDLKKAFDMVDQKILIGKLHYGARGIAMDWFCSCLANKKQFVLINNHICAIQRVLTGFPQEYLPLFLILINDLHNCTKYSRTYYFADDPNFLHSRKSLQNLGNKASHDHKISLNG